MFSKIEIIAAIVWTVIVFTAGWQTCTWRNNSDKAATLATQLQNRVGDEKKAAAVDSKAQGTIASDKQKADTIIQKETAYVQKEPAYNCVVPADGLHAIRNLVAARSRAR